MGRSQPYIEQSCHDIFDSIEEGVFTVDLKWRITSFNRAAEKITGVSRKEAIGRPCSAGVQHHYLSIQLCHPQGSGDEPTGLQSTGIHDSIGFNAYSGCAQCHDFEGS
jgi:PAS domain-containing protein